MFKLQRLTDALFRYCAVFRGKIYMCVGCYVSHILTDKN